MKSTTLCIISAAAFLQTVAAFPTLNPAVADSLVKRQTSGDQDGVPLKCTPVQPAFDAASQYVSNQGQYGFVAPGPTDARGPCPGLNAMANHGYLPHNGVANIPQFISGTFDAFGMAQDLSGFLAVYGSIFDGNLHQWSIGGASPDIEPLSGLLGTPQGISGSHNNYENDASPVRGDLYTYGNDYLNQVSLFQQFFDYQEGISDEEANFGLDNITEFRKARFDNSIAENPYFFNGIFSGVIASPAAYTFIYRFMANHSAEYPEGRLDRNTLMHFYSMTGSSGDFQYTPGYESFPDYWYKRNPADSYTIPYFFCDAFNMIQKYPEFASLGGNTGTVNTFTGVDPANLTGGVYNLQTLTQGNNAMCYGFQGLLEASPQFLEGIFTDVTPAHNMLSEAIANATNPFNCPQIETLQYGQFNQYPGFTKSYSGYTGKTL